MPPTPLTLSLHSKPNLPTLILFLSCIFLTMTSSNCFTQFSHNHFHYGANLTPHPDKVEKGGEDAYFANNYVLAVADGVGGWTLQGIDPSKYSKALCSVVGILLKENDELYKNNPKALITESANRDPHEGSSTFVVVYLDRDNPILRTSYIGDSLYVIYRKISDRWRVFFEAEDQQRAFNFPYQLGNNGGDPPSLAREFTHNIYDKDIVVVASDGLFDNLTPTQVLMELSYFIDEDDKIKDPQAAADRLAKVAFDLSINPRYNSPFAQRAWKADLFFQGGKSDDITVIVGQINLYNKEEDIPVGEPREEEKAQVEDGRQGRDEMHERSGSSSQRTEDTDL